MRVPKGTVGPWQRYAPNLLTWHILVNPSIESFWSILAQIVSLSLQWLNVLWSFSSTWFDSVMWVKASRVALGSELLLNPTWLWIWTNVLRQQVVVRRPHYSISWFYLFFLTLLTLYAFSSVLIQKCLYGIIKMYSDSDTSTFDRCHIQYFFFSFSLVTSYSLFFSFH